MEAISCKSGFTGPFKNVCAERPDDYSYYDKYDVAWNTMDHYQIQ